MFGDLSRKLIPLGIAAAGAYTGTSMFGGGSAGSIFASSSLTDGWKKKLTMEAIKKGVKGLYKTDAGTDIPYSSPSYANMNFDDYLMEMAASEKAGTGEFPGPIKSTDPEAVAYAWQRRLNSYVGSGEIT